MRKVIPFLVAALVIGVMVWQQRTPETVLLPAPTVEFPQIAGMRVEELAMSESERETLPKDTVILRRRYVEADGHWYILSAVIGGRSKSSVHRPELCLPGQGYKMSVPHTLAVGDIDWRVLALEKSGEGRAAFAYTFANGTGLRTASHLRRIFADVWDRSVRGRIDRWVMLTVATSRTEELSLAKFLGYLEGVVK